MPLHWANKETRAKDEVLADMQFLCEDIITGYGARKIARDFVRDESQTIRGDARLLIGQCRILRHHRASALRKELTEYRAALAPTAHVYLKKCHHRRIAMRSDLLGAGQAWRAMATELKERRVQSAND